MIRLNAAHRSVPEIFVDPQRDQRLSALVTRQRTARGLVGWFVSGYKQNGELKPMREPVDSDLAVSSHETTSATAVSPAGLAQSRILDLADSGDGDGRTTYSRKHSFIV
jgi:hypothetical protein